MHVWNSPLCDLMKPPSGQRHQAIAKLARTRGVYPRTLGLGALNLTPRTWGCPSAAFALNASLRAGVARATFLPDPVRRHCSERCLHPPKT